MRLLLNNNPIDFPYGLYLTSSREPNRNEEGTVLMEKYNITIRGSIVGTSNGQGDSETNLINLIKSGIGVVGAPGSDTRDMYVLEIEGANIIYEQARLVNASFSEPPEDTAGIHFVEATLTFEVYSGSMLRSASESIEIRKENDRNTFDNDTLSDTSKYSFTVTQTISAQGLMTGGSDGYATARAFCENGSWSTSKGASVEKNAAGGNLNTILTLSGMGLSLPNNELNCIRSVNADPVAGSYSITNTFFRSAGKTFTDVTIDVQRDESGEMSASAQGTIQGISTGGPADTSDDRYAAALAAFNSLTANGTFSGGIVAGLCSTEFSASNPDGMILDSYPIGFSKGQNKAKGTYTFNVTYRAYPSAINGLRTSVAGTGTLMATLTITYDNRNSALVQTIATIPIIGRALGPIMQDMGTTQTKRKHVQLDATVKPALRSLDNTALIDTCIGICLGYAPYGTAYISNSNGTWDAATGKVSAFVEWTYE